MSRQKFKIVKKTYPGSKKAALSKISNRLNSKFYLDYSRFCGIDHDPEIGQKENVLNQPFHYEKLKPSIQNFKIVNALFDQALVIHPPLKQIVPYSKRVKYFSYCLVNDIVNGFWLVIKGRRRK